MAITYSPKSKIRLLEELLLVISIITCIFSFSEISGLIKTSVVHNFEYGLVTRMFFLLVGILGVMGVLTNSRINITTFFVICGFEIIHQTVGLTLTSSPEIVLNSIILQSLCASIMLLSLLILLSEQEIGFYKQKLNNIEIKENLAVELINLSKTYDIPGSDIEVKALKGVNIKIKKGDFIAIMGPSGSGKSTLLNMIGALDKASEGDILIDNQNIANLDDDGLAYLRNKKIGFIFQAYNLVGRSTVLQNVEIPALVTKINPQERRKRAIDLLTKVGLADKIHRKPKLLSGGEQQRVAIARALLNQPTILLCDEPTGNLDTKSGERVMDIITELNRDLGMTVIVVTHDTHVGSQTNRIYYLKDGSIEGVKENIVI